MTYDDLAAGIMRLHEARDNLIYRRHELAKARRRGFYPESAWMTYVVGEFYSALDRVWEAQRNLHALNKLASSS